MFKQRLCPLGIIYCQHLVPSHRTILPYINLESMLARSLVQAGPGIIVLLVGQAPRYSTIGAIHIEVNCYSL